jgi:cytochrome c oxidase subunit 2
MLTLVLGSWLGALGCDGPQSALTPAGRDAERIATLFWWMTIGGAFIWTAVVGLAAYVVHFKSKAHSHRAANLLILGGGVAFPVVVLAGLLAYGLSLMPDMLALPPKGGIEIAVTGEQWWWRVRYLSPDGSAVDLANEIRLPVGQRVALRLESPDVIHAFWVPSLAGKIDMIPGRVNRIALEPTRTGVFRGACAEYCGASHAFMNFYVVVTEKSAFDAWLLHQQQPASLPSEPLGARGHRAFISNGCGACHTVRGTPADGVVGPDLTHVGGRVSLAAGMLFNEADAFAKWIAGTEALKPGVHMPAFNMLPADDLRAIAAYLDGLR